MPSPSEYARPSRPARTGSPKFHDIARIAPSVGPMHGAQPMPSATPSSGAPTRPRLLRTCGLNVRWAKPKRPMKTRPSRMMTTPITRVIASAYSRKNRPTVPPRMLTAMNTTVNPAMNSSTPTSSLPREGSWSTAMAVGAASDRPLRRPRRDARIRRHGALPRRNRAADETEVAGHEGQHAGREERDEAGQHRDRQGDPQRAVGDDRAGVHEDSSSVSRTSVVRIDGIRQLTDDARRDAALGIEHERRRRRLDRCLLGERELDRRRLARDRARVGDAVGLARMRRRPRPSRSC